MAHVRTVVGIMHRPDGSVWPDYQINFTLAPTANAGHAILPHATMIATTDVDGAFTVTLEVGVPIIVDFYTSTATPNGASYVKSPLRTIVVPEGDTPISLMELFAQDNQPVPPSLTDIVIEQLTPILEGETGTAALEAHIGNTTNPHNVTSAQVGLGSVDNTSDADKPVSTATASALALKANVADLGTAATADVDDFATAAQGAKADSAVQPGAIAAFETSTQLNARDTANRNRANHTGTQAASTITGLATVATSGAYGDLSGRPTLGTAAAQNATAFATAAQGAKADTAVQPGSLAPVATSGDYADLTGAPTIPAQFNPIAGANVSLSGTYPNITISSSGGGGTGGAVDSVNGQTGAVVLDADDIDDTATAKKFVTGADVAKLANLSGTNTGDQDLSGYATVSALSNGLAGKAGTSHVHEQSDITNLTADLAGKAAVGHNHDGVYVKPADLPAVPDALTDLDTTVTGAQLNALKTKVDGIAAGAEVNVNADWNAASGDAQILNKPTLGTAASQNTSAFATAAQGAKADTAVQPAAIANFETATQLNARDTANRNRANHTGTQAISTIAATGTPSGTTYLRGDGSWNTPTNTTYTEIPTAEIDAGTATTLRTISGRRAQDIVNKARTGLALASSLAPVATSGSYADLTSKPSLTGSVNVEFHGGGAAIAVGSEAIVRMNFACTLVGWEIYSKQTGSIVVDVQRDTFANYPPTAGDSIAASAKPTISSSNKAQNTTLTGWTTAVSAGDILRFNVDSATTVEDVFLSLRYTRTI